MARRSPRWLPLAAGAALVVLTGCSTTGSSSPGGSGGGATGTGPIPVTFSADGAHASTATVDAAGASLTATGADGTRYALTVPPGALATPLKVKLTPLTQVTVEGNAAPWQVGVQLAPEGTQFLKPVTLTISPPQASSTPAAITLVTADGTRYVPQATGTTGTSFTAELDHFSDYLVGPYSPALVGDGIQALLDHLASPPTILDLQAMLRLWPEAQGPALADARTALDQQIAAEIAALTPRQQSDPNPAPGAVIGLIGAGNAAAAAGRTSDADTLNATAQQVFATLMRVFDQQRLQAAYQTPFIPRLAALVDPLAQAVAIARAYPFVLQYAMDPQNEAQTLVDTLVAAADHDCNQAYFKQGLTGLQDAVGAVNLLKLATPTQSELQTDEDSCAAPKVTGVTAVPDTVSASASYSDSTAGDSQNQSNPPALTTGQSFSTKASATVADASATIDMTVTTSADSAQLSFSGTASATVPDRAASSTATATFNADNGAQTLMSVLADQVRGDYLVTVQWQHSTPTTVAGETGGGMTVGGVADPSGTKTYHVHGVHFYAGDPPFPSGSQGIWEPVFNVFGHAGLADYSPDNSASIAVDGTITVTIAPDPNGTVE